MICKILDVGLKKAWENLSKTRFITSKNTVLGTDNATSGGYEMACSNTYKICCNIFCCNDRNLTFAFSHLVVRYLLLGQKFWNAVKIVMDKIAERMKDEHYFYST